MLRMSQSEYASYLARRADNRTIPKSLNQLSLPGLATNNGSEQLDIAGHELAELDERLKREGRFISVLTLRRQGGYTATIQKGCHDASLPQGKERREVVE